MSVEDAIEFITRDLVEHGLIPGAVVGCSVGRSAAPEVRWAGRDALGELLQPDSLFATYCMGKPLLAYVVAVLVEEGELSLNDRIGDLLPCEGSVGYLTVEQCLLHQVSVQIVDGVAALLTPLDVYRENLLSASGSCTSHPKYSEYATWLLLGMAIESLTGEGLSRVAESRVLRPLGLDEQFCLGRLGSRAAERLRVNGSLVAPFQFLPLLAEESTWLEWESNPGFGGYMTVSGVIGLMKSLWSSSQRSHQLIDSRILSGYTTPPHFDATLRRECSFALGSFAGVHTFGLPELRHHRTYGQFGLLGMSGCVVLPDSDTCVAYQLSGYLDMETMDGWVRPGIVRRLLRSEA